MVLATGFDPVFAPYQSAVLPNERSERGGSVLTTRRRPPFGSRWGSNPRFSLCVGEQSPAPRPDTHDAYCLGAHRLSQTRPALIRKPILVPEAGLESARLPVQKGCSPSELFRQLFFVLAR